ncbi:MULTISPECIES: DNA repair protein RecO [Sphingobacterium]|uniref:DNA repair protein RecO n=1 Tax=Sphingobacterium populi TaxID=1812824 RepID=A0ABW5UBY0_9SPHI|nr:DNA repair protein RecO [Sphingobacterium sp. CFCC 11742]
MILRTQGIALKLTDYSENSLVAQIFTRDHGLQSYLVQGAKKPKAKISLAILQPFHLLDMLVYHKDTNQLQRVKEARQYPVLRDIPLNIVKSSIALFLNEVLYKVLRHQNPDPNVFQYIADSIQWLDRSSAKLGNFHLLFLIGLSKHLGFYPSNASKEYLDLAEGIFTNSLPAHAHFIAEPYTSIFRVLMNSTYDSMQQANMSKDERKYLLEKTLDLYRLHTENFGEVRSLFVLEEIFSS